jgi:hypothetical protein
VLWNAPDIIMPLHLQTGITGTQLFAGGQGQGIGQFSLGSKFASELTRSKKQQDDHDT